MGFKTATMSREKLEAAIAQARRYPHKNLHKGDLVITMGAGDINRIGEALVERLK